LTITGTPCIDPGQSGVAYSITAVNRATTYSWIYTGTGFAIATGANTNSITTNFSGSATPGDLTVRPSNGCGYGGTSPNYSIGVRLPTCGGSYTYNTVVAATYTWLDRNLGASRVATASNDYQAYGALYQWGRQSDGHECVNWCSATQGAAQNGTTTTQCPSGVCPNALFVALAYPDDWSIPSLPFLWTNPKTATDPCPIGYRVPSFSELTALGATFNPQNSYGAFNSPVKMPMPGNRYNINGAINYAGTKGQYWSSTSNASNYAWYWYFDSSTNNINDYLRTMGYSVRCILE
jgi:uncharacterized protein (TIGR02145 family)